MADSVLFPLGQAMPLDSPERVSAARVQVPVRNQVEFFESDLESLIPEDHQVRIVRPDLVQRVLAAGADGDRAAVELERDLDQLTDVRLVVDNEHFGDSVTVCHGLSRFIVPHTAAWKLAA